MGYYSDAYTINGVNKYNAGGGINPLWLALKQERLERKEEERKRELSRRLAEERKKRELDLYSEKLEARFNFLKRHSSNQNDTELALKAIQSVSL